MDSRLSAMVLDITGAAVASSMGATGNGTMAVIELVSVRIVVGVISKAGEWHDRIILS